MKRITSTELKEGDWIRTKPIYNSVNKNNELVGIYFLCYVKEIKGKRVYIKTWTITEDTEDKITKGGMFSKGEQVYLLDKGELMNLKKEIILENLK